MEIYQNSCEFSESRSPSSATPAARSIGDNCGFSSPPQTPPKPTSVIAELRAPRWEPSDSDMCLFLVAIIQKRVDFLRDLEQRTGLPVREAGRCRKQLMRAVESLKRVRRLEAKQARDEHQSDPQNSESATETGAVASTAVPWHVTRDGVEK